jgi:outer membrane protein assembly factor BamD
MRKLVSVFLLAVSLLLTAGCNEYQKILKSPNVDYKYEKAVEFYNAGEFVKAKPLFDELLILYRGTEKASEVYYYYAMCSFEVKDFILAAYHFKNFAKTFPNHPKTEMAYYMVGFCNYLESPAYSLDQDFTYKAINDLQLFANLYPTSDMLMSTNELIEELRAKLERKSFERAELYFRREYFQSAVVSFNNVLDDYPDTKFREEAMFKKAIAGFKLAENSVSEKQLQRYIESRTSYLEFLQYFPESDYSKTLDNRFGQINQIINKLKLES